MVDRLVTKVEARLSNVLDRANEEREAREVKIDALINAVQSLIGQDQSNSTNAVVSPSTLGTAPFTKPSCTAQSNQLTLISRSDAATAFSTNHPRITPSKRKHDNLAPNPVIIAAPLPIPPPDISRHDAGLYRISHQSLPKIPMVKDFAGIRMQWELGDGMSLTKPLKDWTSEERNGFLEPMVKAKNHKQLVYTYSKRKAIMDCYNHLKHAAFMRKFRDGEDALDDQFSDLTAAGQVDKLYKECVKYNSESSGAKGRSSIKKGKGKGKAISEVDTSHQASLIPTCGHSSAGSSSTSNK